LSKPVTITVEFYGMPRQQAGRAEMDVVAGSVTDVLAAVERACPDLKDLVRSGSRLAPHILLSLNGKAFVTDLHQQLQAGDRLLLLSADAGG
jgi:molybdopterin converting factor small subunit